MKEIWPSFKGSHASFYVGVAMGGNQCCRSSTWVFHGGKRRSRINKPGVWFDLAPRPLRTDGCKSTQKLRSNARVLHGFVGACCFSPEHRGARQQSADSMLTPSGFLTILFRFGQCPTLYRALVYGNCRAPRCDGWMEGKVWCTHKVGR